MLAFKQKFKLLASVLCIGAVLLIAMLQFETGQTYTVTVVDTIHSPWPKGSVRKLVCDLNGDLIKVHYSRYRPIKIGSKIKVGKKKRLLFSPFYYVKSELGAQAHLRFTLDGVKKAARSQAG